MRTFLKLAASAIAIALLLATIQWTTSGRTIYLFKWSQLDGVLWGTLISQVVAAAAVAALLARGATQPARPLAMALAAGLAGTALYGLAELASTPDVAIWADVSSSVLGLGLVVTLAAMRRWQLMCLAMAALLGAFLRVTLLVLLGLSL